MRGVRVYVLRVEALRFRLCKCAGLGYTVSGFELRIELFGFAFLRCPPIVGKMMAQYL